MLTRVRHELLGAAFSHPERRAQHESEATGVMTLIEVERWLTEEFVGVYHAKHHRGMNTGPVLRWNAGIIGDPLAAGPVTRRSFRPKTPSPGSTTVHRSAVRSPAPRREFRFRVGQR